MEDTKNESSVYNEASFQILRLHELWLKIESEIERGLFLAWKGHLDGVWRELCADVEHLPDKDEIINMNNKLKLKCHTKKNLYDALNERHEFLKRLQDKCGKGAKYEDSNNREFE